jgi:hypothetical protein
LPVYADIEREEKYFSTRIAKACVMKCITPKCGTLGNTEGKTMKFFVPDQSAEHAEDIYNDFRALHKAADKRIRSITYFDKELGAEVQLCVGKDEPWYGGKILLILLCYPRAFVFTKDRGIEAGAPIMVQLADARIEEFDFLDRPNSLSRGA